MALCVVAAMLAERSRYDEASGYLQRAGAFAHESTVLRLLEADVTLRRHELDRAEELLTTLRREISESGPAWSIATRLAARSLAEQDRPAQALEMLAPLVDTDAADLGDLLLCGHLHVQLAHDREATAVFERALSLQPANTRAINALVAEHLLHGREDDAESVLRTAAAAASEEHWLRLWLGDVRARNGQSGEPDAQVDTVVTLGMYSCSQAWGWIGSLRARHGDAEGALAAYARALESSPEDAALAARRGELLVGLGRPRDALAEFERAVSHGRDVAGWHGLLADALMRCGELTAALDEIEHAVALDSQDAWILGTRAQILRRRDKPEEAIVDFRRAVELQPEFTWALAELYQAVFATADAAAALSELERLALPSGEASTPIAVAHMLASQEDFAGARAIVDALVAKTPDLSSDLLVLRAGLEAFGGDRQAAVKDLTAATALDPRAVRPHFVLGTLLGEDREYEPALEALHRAQELEPASAEIASTVARVTAYAYGEPAALDALDAAIARVGADPTLRMQRAELLRDREPAQALEEIARIRRAGRLPAGIDALEGAILTDNGRLKKARRLLRDAIERNHQDSAVRMQLATTLYQLQDYAEGLAVLDSAPEPFPAGEEPYVLGLRGMAHSALGQLEQARGELARAVELNDSLFWAAGELIDLLIRNGEREEARRRLDTILGRPGLELECARLALLLDDNTMALELCERVLEQQPENARAHALRAWALVATGESERAIAGFEESLRMDPADNNVRLRLCDLYLEQDRGLDAVSLLAGATDRELVFKRIGVQYAIGASELADADADALASSADVETLTDLAELLSDCGRPRRALAIIEHLLADPSPATLQVTGAALSATGRFALAATVLEQARARDPNVARVDDALAWAYNNLGSEKAHEFLDVIERLLAARPLDQWLVRGKGDALLLLGRPQEAAACHRQAIELAQSAGQFSSPGDQHAFFGWCRYRLGELDDAVGNLMRAVSIRAPWPRTDRFDLALVLLAAARDGAAHEYAAAIEEADGNPDCGVRCGLLAVALNDLDEAMQLHVVPHARAARIRSQLRSALSERERDLEASDTARVLRRIESIATASTSDVIAPPTSASGGGYRQPDDQLS
ncbi:MAG TPA: tetratricopeptide repeat protein [Solirubrobacteraceae bacterium]|nr:tetratricopeptide repeat protein [Solirubrobacteraceae bacterium]